MVSTVSSLPLRSVIGMVRDRFRVVGRVNAAAVWAGLAAAAWFACGMVPLQVAAAAKLGLAPGQAASQMCSVWLAGAIATLALSLVYQQPLPITWNTAALIYLAAMAGQFTLPELMGANLLAGLLIVLLGLVGAGRRLLQWLPLPLAMGLFAGSVLGDMTRIVSATVADQLVVGMTVAGYAVGRALRSRHMPPIGLAMIAGGLAVVVTHRLSPVPITWGLPTLAVPAMRFSLPAVIAVSLPLVMLAMGLGNVQGLGFLQAQGYRVPATAATVAVGLASVASALFGGHPANVSRFGVATLAGPEAGPKAGRYQATLVAALMMLLIALAASPVTSLLTIVPQSLIVALAGLAILASFQDALTDAFSGRLRFGALVTFIVAAASFSAAGLPAACWALPVGLTASLVVERDELLACWRGERPRRRRRCARPRRHAPPARAGAAHADGAVHAGASAAPADHTRSRRRTGSPSAAAGPAGPSSAATV